MQLATLENAKFRARTSLGRLSSALLASVILSYAFMMILPSCVATYDKKTGTVELEFAPDMVITAVGYEDAKDQVSALWRACLSGEWDRPCTKAEMDEIVKTYNQILAEKGSLVG